MTIASNKLSQSKDIAGSRNQNSSLDVANESLMLGSPISGQNGTTATISGTAPNMIVSGLSGLTAASNCRYLTLSGADSAGNNGTFQITDVLSPTSVQISNPSGTAVDANNGSITWIERNSYSLEDDLNYARSDRANIKGVDYDEPVPTYTRCDDQLTEIPANLANIAGNTTDAKSFVINRVYYNIDVNPGDTFVTINDIGNLKHADSVNLLGVPVYDGYDIGRDVATFAIVLDDGYDGYATELTVISGSQAGYRIYGRTREGSSVSPDSVEVEFRAVPLGAPLSASEPYSWEVAQPSSLNIIIGYRECLSSIDDAAFRQLMIAAILYGGQGSGGGSSDDSAIRQIIGVGTSDTDLSLVLTNLTNNFVFSDLPNANPTVVDALNALNEQIGDRNYTGPYLLDGYTITESLQALSDAIEIGGGGGGCTIATEYGQVCFSADGLTFAPELPVVNDEGLILTNFDGRIVVVGGP